MINAIIWTHSGELHEAVQDLRKLSQDDPQERKQHLWGEHWPISYDFISYAPLAMSLEILIPLPTIFARMLATSMRWPLYDTYSHPHDVMIYLHIVWGLITGYNVDISTKTKGCGRQPALVAWRLTCSHMNWCSLKASWLIWYYFVDGPMRSLLFSYTDQSEASVFIGWPIRIFFFYG